MDNIKLILGDAIPVFVTSTGVKLYLEHAMIKELNRDIKRLKLENLQVFMAVTPEECIYYLLVENGKPCYHTQSLEAISCYIDMISLANK